MAGHAIGSPTSGQSNELIHAPDSHASTPLILRKIRMRRRTSMDLVRGDQRWSFLPRQLSVRQSDWAGKKVLDSLRVGSGRSDQLGERRDILKPQTMAAAVHQHRQSDVMPSDRRRG